jgi:hypothetical protein
MQAKRLSKLLISNLMVMGLPNYFVQYSDKTTGHNIEWKFFKCWFCWKDSKWISPNQPLQWNSSLISDATKSLKNLQFFFVIWLFSVTIVTKLSKLIVTHVVYMEQGYIWSSQCNYQQFVRYDNYILVN